MKQGEYTNLCIRTEIRRVHHSFTRTFEDPVNPLPTRQLRCYRPRRLNKPSVQGTSRTVSSPMARSVRQRGIADHRYFHQQWNDVSTTAWRHPVTTRRSHSESPRTRCVTRLHDLITPSAKRVQFALLISLETPRPRSPVGWLTDLAGLTFFGECQGA